MGWKQDRKIDRLEEQIEVLQEKLDEANKPAPVVKVISVTHVKNRKIRKSFHSGYHHSDYEEVEGVATLVLVTVDGKAEVRTLEGTWSLKDLENVQL